MKEFHEKVSSRRFHAMPLPDRLHADERGKEGESFSLSSFLEASE